MTEPSRGTPSKTPILGQARKGFSRIFGWTAPQNAKLSAWPWLTLLI